MRFLNFNIRNVYWRYGGGSASFLPESIAIINAMIPTPNIFRQILINNFVSALIAADIWNSLDRLWVMAAVNEQSAQLDWKSPATVGRALLPINAPVFQTDRGYTGNGTTSTISTLYTPSVDGVTYTQDDASFWVWSRTAGAVSIADAGNVTGFRNLIQLQNSGSTIVSRVNTSVGAAVQTGAGITGIGLFGATRRSIADQRNWQNGVQVGATGITVSEGIPAAVQWIGGSNPSSFSGRQFSIGAFGNSLSGKELAFYNAALAYMQGVGAA